MELLRRGLPDCQAPWAKGATSFCQAPFPPGGAAPEPALQGLTRTSGAEGPRRCSCSPRAWESRSWPGLCLSAWSPRSVSLSVGVEEPLCCHKEDGCLEPLPFPSWDLPFQMSHRPDVCTRLVGVVRGQQLREEEAEKLGWAPALVCAGTWAVRCEHPQQGRRRCGAHPLRDSRCGKSHVPGGMTF